MASFQSKTGRERLRMWGKKILVLIHSNPTWNMEFQKNSKKIQKKLKNIIMAFFQAKTRWDRLRMGEKKNHSYQFLSNLEYKIPKK